MAASARPSVGSAPEERALVLARVLDAPCALVFKAWTDPKQVARWWGPQDFTNPVCELEARPGGVLRIDMRAPDGVGYPMTGVFREVVEPARLVFTAMAWGKAGNPLLEALTTVIFAERAGRTTLTVEARIVKSIPEAAPMLDGMAAGWTQSLDRLAAHLARRKKR